MRAIQRTFIPGDNWVYFKIYTGVITADWIITEKLYPVINRLIKSKKIDKFFFIRYNDPDYHIRLRLLLSDRSYFSDTIDVIFSILNPIIAKQLVWKIQLDTYERELERYNKYLIAETESLFYIDSIYVINIIKNINNTGNDNNRWMIAILLIDSMLSDFGLSIEKKEHITHSISDLFKSNFGFDKFNSKQFNKKYHTYKRDIESIMIGKDVDGQLYELTKIVSQRSLAIEKTIKNINQIVKTRGLNISDYIGSYIHMTMNRLFIADNNLYELIIYDFMKRYYASEIVLINLKQNNTS